MGFPSRVARDVAHAFRSVRRAPRYAASVIATFALASGANIAVFSVVDSVLLEPLPYPEPDDLVMVHRVTDHGEDSGASYLDLEDWRAGTRAFSGWAGYRSSRRVWLGPTGAEAWTGVEATDDLFGVLGVEPLLGRTLRPVDRPGDAVIVVSHGLWRDRLGADPDIVGRTLRFESGSATVVGVMGPDFYFPTPDEVYWSPLVPDRFLQQRGAWFLQTLARLAPGVTAERAEAEVQTVAEAVALETSTTAEGTRLRVETRHEAYVGDTRTLFAILMGAVGLVLVIACANIANLALARATIRGRELAVRSALGAGRARLGSQLVAEHVILALGGVAAGLLLSVLVVRGFIALGPEGLPRLAEARVDTTALLYAMLVAVAGGVLFGSAPALSATRTSLFPALKDAGRRSLGRGGRRSLGTLVVAQVSLAVVLVVGASLLVNSFLRLSAVRPGFDMDRVVAVRIDLPAARYETPEATEAFYGALRDRLIGRAGVAEVGFTTHLPFSGSNIQATYHVESDAGERGEHAGLSFEVVSPGYFGSAGIERVAGRDFTDADGPGSAPVVVVSRHLADIHWPGESPIGRRLTLDDSEDGRWHEVIGVVGVTLKRGLDDEARPVAYFPRRQFSEIYGFISGRGGFITIRSETAAGALIPLVRTEIAALDPDLPLTRVETGRELVMATMVEPRFRTTVLGAFAVVALLVALVGVYGVIAFAVSRRTREIGIRMALGASRAAILGQVLRSSAALLIAGLLLGTGAGLAASRALSSMLYGVSTGDPLSYGVAAAVVIGAGLVACYLPARRASRVEPVVALRED